MRIGVDVGGTNTDAVIMDGRNVLSAHKTPTTPRLSEGIIAAIGAALKDTAVDAQSIEAVMIGTTHFTNAFVERKGLMPVGVVRIALPSSRGILPFSDWPSDLSRALCGQQHLVEGGYHFDGRVADPLDEKAIAAAARSIRSEGLRTVAVTGLFSPVNPAMEHRAKEIIENEAPELSVTLSSQIGRMGILERENAAIMNASLAELSRDVVESFRSALEGLAISAPFFISQNDGALMSADYVERYPVLTFASGPTNSMRGAAYLSGLADALVADIGGTTTDIGMLKNGFPRESSLDVGIGGVRTNFRMPDILALGLGGGSLVEEQNGALRIGPRSLGYRLTEEALVFGGKTTCATDLAVAAGGAEIGDRRRVSHLSPELVAGGLERVQEMLAAGVDQMKTSAKPVPLILVGGGSLLVTGSVAGASETIVPEHAAVANAIGAAIAQVSGETDRVFAYEETGRDAALDAAKQEARERAVAAGADAGSLQIVDLDEMPLAYMPGGAVRIRLKVVGDLERIAPTTSTLPEGHA